MSWLLPPLPPKWSAALRDVDAQRADSRIAAAQRLGKPSDAAEHAEAFEGLRKLAADRDARVRAAALDALGALLEVASELHRSITAVLRERLTDSDSSVRELAALGLSELGWDVARDALLEALASDHPEVRFQALGAAAQSGDPRAARHVLALLDDRDSFVRAAAVHAAGLLEPDARPEAVGAKLRAALRDPEHSVRCEAGIALAEEGEREAAEALLEALPDPAHVFDALDVAPHLPDDRVREQVAYMASSVLGSRVIAAAAGRALARMRDPRGVKILRDVLGGWRTHGRTLAVQTIGELELSELAPEVIRLSERPRAVDPAALAASLASFGASTPDAARALQRLANRSDAFGEAAREALVKNSNFGTQPAEIK